MVRCNPEKAPLLTLQPLQMTTQDRDSSFANESILISIPCRSQRLVTNTSRDGPILILSPIVPFGTLLASSRRCVHSPVLANQASSHTWDSCTVARTFLNSPSRVRTKSSRAMLSRVFVLCKSSYTMWWYFADSFFPKNWCLKVLCFVRRVTRSGGTSGAAAGKA